MGSVRIGIVDREEKYAGRLASYLNRMGSGGVHAAVFTKEESLADYMKKRGLDIILGTDGELLEQMQKTFDGVRYIWLTEGRRAEERNCAGIYLVYRYQKAEEIRKEVNNILSSLGLLGRMKKQAAAVFSPVGRCGKTTLALDLVKKNNGGKWLYIGMEDYGHWTKEEGERGDAFLYFWKERQGEKLLSLLKEAGGIIPTSLSPFDARQLGREDVEWLLEVINGESGYQGILFDIGVGALKELSVLGLFDLVIVPRLPEERAVAKVKRFEELLSLQGLEELREKLYFVSMEEKSPERRKLEGFLGERR